MMRMMMRLALLSRTWMVGLVSLLVPHMAPIITTHHLPSLSQVKLGFESHRYYCLQVLAAVPLPPLSCLSHERS